MANEVCFRTKHLPQPGSLATFLSVGGYEQWRDIITQRRDPAIIVADLQAAQLRGRGGAGFHAALKWGFVQRANAEPKYVVCNSDEGEPGTCKDRDILRFNPHQVIEGMAIAAYVMGAQRAYNYIRGEYQEPWQCFELALDEARQAGLLGRNILGSGLDFDIFCHLGAGSYVCGEETALLESLEGKKGLPRFKPPFPAIKGLYGCPTLINNTETFASIPPILANGADWFAKLGTTNSHGTKIFSVTGHVNKPGNYEVSLGTPFSELLALAGGVRSGRKLKAVIPGGTSMPILPAEIMMQLNMDFDSISKAGSQLGSGAVIVMDDSTSMAEVLACISKFYMEESCGQCSPCREGTAWLYHLADKLVRKDGASVADIDQLTTVANNICGRTICAFGEAAAWPVLGIVKHFRDELVAYIAN